MRAVIVLLIFQVLAGIGDMPFRLPEPSTAVYELAGIVTSKGGDPIAAAEVTLRRPGEAAAAPLAATHTAADGSFSFWGLGPGSAIVQVRRIGYLLHTLTINIDSAAARTPLQIRLDVSAIELDTLTVAARGRARIQEFNERRRTRKSGYFIGPEDIGRRRAAYSSDLLRSLPGVVVRRGPRGEKLVRMRNCRPAIFIDGTQALNAELDEITRPTEIEAIEAYGSWAGVPPQFSDRFGKSCGAILIWTKL